MRKQLYLDIQSKLLAITTGTGDAAVPVFKHFDLWNQNVEFLEQDSPFERPAIFVEFAPLAWETLGKNQQTAVLTIKLHIVTDWFANTARYNPDQDTALNYLDMPDQIVKALTCVYVNGTNSLTRSRSTINHNHGRYLDSVEEFTAMIKDNSAMDILTNIAVKPTIVIDTNL